MAAQLPSCEVRSLPLAWPVWGASELSPQNQSAPLLPTGLERWLRSCHSRVISDDLSVCGPFFQCGWKTKVM